MSILLTLALAAFLCLPFVNIQAEKSSLDTIHVNFLLRPTHSNEKYVAALVQKKMSIPGAVTAHILTGGFSSSRLFVITTTTNKFIAKVLNAEQTNVAEEIANANIASQEGYGPHVYYSDPLHEIIIMEFLEKQKIDPWEYQNNNLPTALAMFLRKIHNGPSFANSKNIFDYTFHDLQTLKNSGHTGLPIDILEQHINHIRSALGPCTTKPCHNDPSLYNLIWLGDRFKAIDYETAGQSDPYVDLATTAIFFCVTAECEKIFLTAYFGRPPSGQEQERFELMKQLSLINYAIAVLAISSQEPNLDKQYNSLKAPTHQEMLHELYRGNINIKQHEDRLIFAKAMINEVFSNTNTPKK
jgi:hypothetical protein